MSDTSTSGRSVGKIIEIKGVVVDAVFPDGLPEILSALEIELPNGTLVADGKPAPTTSASSGS